MNQSKLASSKYLAVNATVTTLCRGLGVATGIVLDAVIVTLFGISQQTDAYFAALAIPILIAYTVEGQGPKILVPFFAQGFQSNGRQATWAQLRNLIAIGSLLFFAVAAALTAAAWLLMPIQVPGFDPEAVSLAIRLHMILAWLVLTQGLSSIVAGALFADHRYFVTSISKFTVNLVTVVVVALWHRSLGIYALALGMIAGSSVQLMFLVGVATWQGFRLGRVQVRDPSVTPILRRCIYPLVGHALAESKVFLENFLGSLLGGGAVSAIRYATRIVESISHALVGGLVTTSLPIVSHHAAARAFDDMKEAVLKAIRFTSLLAVPLGLWLVFAGESLVSVAFERGRFSSADSARIGLLVALLAPYILSSRICGLMELPFYATMDTRTPLWAIVVFLLSYVAVCLGLLSSAGVYAFPIATSIGAIVTAIWMIKLVERRFGALPWEDSKEFGRRLAIVTAVSILGFLVGAAANLLVVYSGPLAKWARFVTATVPGLTAFLGAAVLVRLFNWQHMLDMVRHMWRPRKVAGAPV